MLNTGGKDMSKEQVQAQTQPSHKVFSKIEVNLENLYVLSPQSTACKILYSILRNYDVKMEKCVEFSPNAGTLLYEVKNGEVRIKQHDLLYRLNKTETPEEFEETIQDYAKKRGLIVVKLYDGYESAWGLVSLPPRWIE